jgi:hypothetical protein
MIFAILSSRDGKKLLHVLIPDNYDNKTIYRRNIPPSCFELV